MASGHPPGLPSTDASRAPCAALTGERLHAAGWREAPYLTDAERAALLLSEAVTTLDSRDPVPDAVLENATRHFGEKPLAALVLWISLVNLFNRANIATRQPAGTPLPKRTDASARKNFATGNGARPLFRYQ